MVGNRPGLPRLALAHGGGLAGWARDDLALEPVRSDFKEGILKPCLKSQKDLVEVGKGV